MNDDNKTSAEIMRNLINIAQGKNEVSCIDEIWILNTDNSSVLHEGKWISGRFNKNIRIDNPTYGVTVGDVHAHVFGRKQEEIVIVKCDETSSHGTKGRLHARDADTLRSIGFNIHSNNIVEWALFKMPVSEFLCG